MGGIIILVLAILFLTQIPADRESMKWAKSLKKEEIEKIELLVEPSSKKERYQLFAQDRKAHV